jgi:uncharacterized glyoxalase superfamily protein PhnB
MGQRHEFRGVTPYLYYDDAGAMMAWLERVFAFEQMPRYVDKSGRVREGAVKAGDAEIWVTGTPWSGYWKAHGRGELGLTLIWVADVDAHHAHVVAQGVAADPPQDQTYGVRSYNVTDPEGYKWGFMQRLGTSYRQTKSLEEGGLKEVPPGRR